MYFGKFVNALYPDLEATRRLSVWNSCSIKSDGQFAGGSKSLSEISVLLMIFSLFSANNFLRNKFSYSFLLTILNNLLIITSCVTAFISPLYGTFTLNLFSISSIV